MKLQFQLGLWKKGMKMKQSPMGRIADSRWQGSKNLYFCFVTINIFQKLLGTSLQRADMQRSERMTGTRYTTETGRAGRALLGY